MSNDCSKQDMKLIFEKCTVLLSDAKTFPMTYTYAGKTYHGLPAESRKTWRALDANMTETVYTAKIPGSSVSLRAECVLYRDFPVAEWTVYFTNEGDEDSAILQDVWSADLAFQGKGAVVHHNNGDFYSETGYTPGSVEMKPGTVFSQAPSDGRACNEAWPYQRLMFEDYGLNIAIGWPGQWQSVYEGKEDVVHFKAGQQVVHTYLKPGETLRTPRMCVMAFEGGMDRAVNLWRRWMIAHVVPKAHGKIVQPVAVFSEHGDGPEHTLCSDQVIFKALDTMKDWDMGEQCLWWIDAGWYSCYRETGKKDWTKTGTWEPDWARYPSGMGGIGKRIHEMGMDLLIWYEPERVQSGTWLALRHPEWLLAKRELESGTTIQHSKEDFMLNLANEECYDWLCKQIDTLIKESGQDVYRQDYNFAPLPYWRFNEKEDRQGMRENLYLQNYLRFWDYLLEHNPNLWIDSCASGGRRNDLETLRRSVPLHPTDYGYGYHHVNQAFRHTIHAWFPYARSWSNDWLCEDDEHYAELSETWKLPWRGMSDYSMINGFGSTLSIGSISNVDKIPGLHEHIREMLGIWRKFSAIQLTGDFYALTENHRSPEKWTVFQFDCPQEGKGALQVLRNPQAPQESLTVFPRGICPCGEYMLCNEQSGESYTVSGAEILKNGITLKQPKRSGAIWFYTKTR